MPISVITHNPFRMLGVFINSSAKDIVANVNKAKAYISVGRELSFSSDLISFIAPIQRTQDSINLAQSQIVQTTDKVKYALFWFANDTSFDEIALGYLNTNNIQKAKEILQKKQTYSSLLNLGIIALCENDLKNAIQNYTILIHDYHFRTCFLNAACDIKAGISEEELSHIFFDSILEFFPAYEVLAIYNSSSNTTDMEYLKEKFISVHTNLINAEINKAKNASKDATSQLAAGNSLMENTKAALQQLKQLIGTDKQYQFQIIADSLARQILQNGISYYNSSSDYDKARKAYKLQNYALSIAVGNLIKERCQENLSILEKAINNLPPSEFEQVQTSLERIIKNFNNSNNEIKDVIQFIKNCAPYLADIRDRTGINDKYYRRASTQIEEVALSSLISIVNRSIKDFETSKYSLEAGSLFTNSLFNDRYFSLSRLKSTLSDAWEATAYLELLDIEPSSQERLANQKASLKKLLNQLDASTYVFPIKFKLVSHAEKQKLLDSISRCSTFKEATSLYPKCFDDETLLKLDDKCFTLCQTKSNYKKYVKLFGYKARHKAEAEEHFKFDLMLSEVWDKHKRLIITIPILLVILVGIGLIWGLHGYSGLLGIIGAIAGLAAFGSLNDKEAGCGTSLICLLIAAASIGGAYLIDNYADKHKSEKEEITTLNNLRNNPTVEDCQSFLRKYPNSSHSDEVFEIYYSCAEANGIESLNEFARVRNSTDLGKKAAKRVEQICDSLYMIADELNTIQAWEDYQAAVPIDYYADSDEKINNLENQDWDTEPEAWNQAKKENTLSAYQKYLNLYPQGEHKAQADKKIIDIRVANVYAGEHGDLPSMDQVGYGGGSTSSISINNNTPYTLTILYSGPDSKSVEIPSHQTKHVTLKNGAYTIAAFVDAAGVGRYAGSETLRGGSYSIEYYIVTTKY